MFVNEIMNSNPAIITPQASLGEALKLMADRKARHVVVVDETDQVAGILSDRDLAFYYDPSNMTEESWTNTPVRQIMSPAPVTIGSGAEVKAAARLLLKTAVSALPVVDNGILVGILSDRDFTRHFARD